MLYHFYRQCPENYYPYTIQPGDTLNYIANRLETSVSRILAANPGIDPYHLRIGQMICIPACPPNHTAKIVQSGDTLYKIAQAHHVSISSILEANPGIDPNYLRVGQRICIPSACSSDDSDMIEAMQNDISMLQSESRVQQIHESNYGNSGLTTHALKVTDRELQFDAVPVVFPYNYIGHYTQGHNYPYYTDAAAGGQRGITVKDNFGVWHSFGYHVPLPQ